MFRAMSKAVKIKMYKTMIPVAVCGSETCAMVKMDMKEQGTWERITIGREGPMVEQGVWRIITNQELRGLYTSRCSNIY
jgi:hypothetical protein